MRIQKNVPLKKYTTFKIGGPAKYFCLARNKKDLIEAIKWAKEKKMPFFILGGGSNLLVSDRGFDGLVIKFQNPKLGDFVEQGLEWAAGIPGTLAGAVRGNAGAFGRSMEDVVKEVEVFDVKTRKIKIFKNKQCQFSYRNSIFKKNPNLIILSVKIKTGRADPKKIKQYLNYRKIHHPQLPSAGSVFKNPKGVGAAKLIADCGLAGKQVGRAQISIQHPNFIVNLGGAKASDVLKLINLTKRKVKNKFKIKLQEEIQYLGKF